MDNKERKEFWMALGAKELEHKSGCFVYVVW